MLKHNKKRNVGLLNEFFAQYMANAAVEFRFDDYQKADNLWKKYFKENTELSKELKMFESLYGANLRDRNVAYNLIQKIKEHVKSQNQEKLDREKTNLLHEVNNTLNDEEFFSRPVNNYKTNATIQLVLNSWRNDEDESTFADFSRLEEQVLDHMVESKNDLPPLDPKLLSKTQEDIDQIVINVFREKMEKKYQETLTEDQKEILGLYTFSNKNNESKQKLTQKLKNIRDSVSQKIKEEMKSEDSNTPREKLTEVGNLLNEKHYDVENLSEDTIKFYLSVCSLKHELDS